MLPTPVLAELPDKTIGMVRWMETHSTTDLLLAEMHAMDIAAGGVIVVDPLTYHPDFDWPSVGAPAGPAHFFVTLDRESRRVSKAVLLFSNAEPVCGHDEATLGVDTGLAAFLDRPRATALVAAGSALGVDENLYDDWFAALIDDTPVVAEIVPLPSGASFPMMSSGWGDGGDPVASLRDKEGAMVALYVDFMGMDAEGNWMLPPECDAMSVTFLDFPAVSPSNL